MTDEALNRLCGFDLLRALNVLLETVHANDGVAARRGAAFEAHMHVFHIREGMGQERIFETRYVAAIASCRKSVHELLGIAREREQLEATLEAHTHGSRPLPRPITLTRGALRLASTLDRYLRALEQKWTFNSDGRTLPGTVRGRGAPKRALLGEVEQILSAGGFSHAEISRLDLDGSLHAGAEQAAEQRVRDRLRSDRRSGK